MNTKPKIECKDEKQPDERTDAHTNLNSSLSDLDILIEHFEHPAYNPAQLRVMRRVREHINSAAKQIDNIPGLSKGEEMKESI